AQTFAEEPLMCARLLFATALACRAAIAGAAEVNVNGCVELDRTELKRLVALELGLAQGAQPGVRVTVVCVAGEAELRVRSETGLKLVRSLDLTSTPPSAQAR